MPLPNIAKVPLFEGVNTTKFFNHFENLCKDYSILDEDKLLKLVHYYLQNIRDMIISLKK
jgi:hypothetical protein